MSPAGIEPATLCLEGRCSIQLSYGLLKTIVAARRFKFESCKGILGSRLRSILFLANLFPENPWKIQHRMIRSEFHRPIDIPQISPCARKKVRTCSSAQRPSQPLCSAMKTQWPPWLVSNSVMQGSAFILSPSQSPKPASNSKAADTVACRKSPA